MSHSEQKKPRIALNILATSDVHGALTSGAEGEPPNGGLARISTIVQDIRKKSTNILLLDNGDFLQGTPLCDLMAESANSANAEHHVIRAMNRLGYDAVGLGNHEFDFGLPFLNAALGNAQFPVIASNVDCADQPWHKTIILERSLKDDSGNEHFLKIGLFSVLPEQVTAWNAAHLKGQLTTSDITQTATNTAKSLRQKGAQIVIALVHSGIGGAISEARQENAAIPIATCADIDALICGHTHQAFPDGTRKNNDHVDFKRGRICDVPAVMPGFNGAYLGQIILQIKPTEQGYAVVDADTRLHVASPSAQSDEPAEDLAMANIEKDASLVFADHLKESIGVFHLPVHSFFSRLPGDLAVAVVAQAQLDFAKRELKEYLPSDLPLISAASPFKGGGRGGPGNFACVPPGQVTRQDLTNLHPFQNTLVALEVNGTQLKEWLEMSASNFNQIQPDSEDNELRNTSFPCYGFDTIFGVTYAIDLTQHAKYNVLGKIVSNSQRIQDLMWEGEPVEDDQKFILLTTSYRAGGGGNYPNAEQLSQLDIPALDCRKVLADFAARGVNLDDLPESPWCFAKVANASARALIGPGVLPYFALGQRPEVEITAGPLDQNGFVPFAVNLGG